jgi:CheY-like chemotaxis protein
MSAVPATILIIDDEAGSRKLLEAQLKPEGYLTAPRSAHRARLVAGVALRPRPRSTAAGGLSHA